MKDIVTVSINGAELQTFESIELISAMSRISAGFSFTYKPRLENINDRNVLTNIVKPQDGVVIKINNQVYLTGFVDEIAWSQAPNSNLITVTGRDKIGYVVDSYIKPNTYTERNLESLIQLILKDNGWNNFIKVQSVVEGDIIIDDQEKNITTDGGESIFQFIDRYAKKTQVLLSSNSNGDIIIYREGDVGTVSGRFPTQREAPIALINSINTQNTNMLSTNFTASINERYNVVEIFSQSSNANRSVKNSAPSGIAIDSQITTPRRMRILNHNPTQTTTLESMAKWRVNLKRARAFQYTCELEGISFSPENQDYWKCNTYVQVLDDVRAIDGEFLIEDVKFRQSSEGTFTNLTIVNKGCYTLDIEKAIKRLNRNNFGKQFQ